MFAAPGGSDLQAPGACELLDDRFQAGVVDGAVELGDHVAGVGGAADSHDGVAAASVGKRDVVPSSAA
jgi:hypothetical protein